MKIIYKLSLKLKRDAKNIFFGIPNNEDEMQKMFSLREKIYKKSGYINMDSDKDEYDSNGKCVYFIAEIDEEIIGTVRLIIDNPLPTQKDCFDFEEPFEMEKISKDKRGEMSRLISVPYKEKIYLPRHLVMLFLIACVLKYSEENGIIGGYSFITSKLYGKISKIKVPFHSIKNYRLKYPDNGLMHPYFSKPGNPILPISYNIGEIGKYINDFLKNKFMFKKLNEFEFQFKNNLYTKFLKLLKVF